MKNKDEKRQVIKDILFLIKKKNKTTFDASDLKNISEELNRFSNVKNLYKYNWLFYTRFGLFDMVLDKKIFGGKSYSLKRNYKGIDLQNVDIQELDSIFEKMDKDIESRKNMSLEEKILAAKNGFSVGAILNYSIDVRISLKDNLDKFLILIEGLENKGFSLTEEENSFWNKKTFNIKK